ncbi:MAG: TOBE domain-containing protein, partial [Pseudomonadota bacterium]
LDAILRVSMRAELKHLHEELKTTTVYVTHDQIEAMTMATRVVVMKDGEVSQIGTPEEIYGNPDNLFVATFIGSPPMNCLPGRLTDGTFSCDNGLIEGFAFQAAGSVILGVRPDNVSLTEGSDADLRGTVFAVEFTGSGLLVVVEVGDQMVTLFGDPAQRPRMNDNVGLKIDRTGVFFFDADTGRRLHLEPNVESRAPLRQAPGV